MSRILAIFAHPDDAELACGATLHRFSEEGSHISVAVACSDHGKGADAFASAKNAMYVLGNGKSYHLHMMNYEDSKLDKLPVPELVSFVSTCIDDHMPTVVITHHYGDANQDHRALLDAVQIATRPLMPGDFRKRVPIVMGEVPSASRMRFPASWEPNLFVRVSKDDLEAKVAAMACYATERRNAPHPRSPESLMALATVRGSESGSAYAEAFQVIRAYLD